MCNMSSIQTCARSASIQQTNWELVISYWTGKNFGNKVCHPSPATASKLRFVQVSHWELVALDAFWTYAFWQSSQTPAFQCGSPSRYSPGFCVQHKFDGEYLSLSLAPSDVPTEGARAHIQCTVYPVSTAISSAKLSLPSAYAYLSPSCCGHRQLW